MTKVQQQQAQYILDGAEVKLISHTHVPNQIAERLGMTYERVIQIQSDPQFEIVDPKRERARTGTPKQKVKPGFFDYNDFK